MQHAIHKAFGLTSESIKSAPPLALKDKCALNDKPDAQDADWCVDVAKFNKRVLGSISASTPACHAGERGSTPRQGVVV